MKNLTTNLLCETLEDTFTCFGYPRIVVSDNGTQFTSGEFKRYCRVKGIKHITSSPYHPRTNGLAERVVRTFKIKMKATEKNKTRNETSRLREVLFTYRNTPHSTTGKSPAESMFGRQLGNILENMKPNYRDEIRFKHLKQELQQDKPERKFRINQAVYCRTKLERSWTPATISDQTNRYSYKILTPDGIIRRRHADHIKERMPSEQEMMVLPAKEEERGNNNVPTITNTPTDGNIPTDPVPAEIENNQRQDKRKAEEPAGVLRRSTRKRRSPRRYSPSKI